MQAKSNSNPSSQSSSNAAAELKALQKQVAELKDELTSFRADLNKKLLKNPSDIVAFGVLKAGLVLFVLGVVLQGIFARG